MASNYDEPAPSDEEVISEASDELASQLEKINRCGKARFKFSPCSVLPPSINTSLHFKPPQSSSSSEPSSSNSGIAQSPSQPSNELQIILQRHEAAMQDIDLMKQARSALALTEYYEEHKNYDKSLQYYERLYEIYMQMFGPDSTSGEMAYVLCHIAFCLRKLKRYKQSLKWHRNYVAIRETQPPTLGQAECYNDYAFVLQETYYYKDALYYAEKSMRVQNSLISGNTQQKVQTLIYIGRIYKHLGDHSKSHEHLNQALIMHHDMHGTTTPHVDIAICLEGIAFTRAASGDYSLARTFYIEALEQFKEIHQSEPYHVNIEITTSNVGLACFDAGYHLAAEISFRELISIRKTKYGEKSRHEEMIMAYRNLIKALKAQNKMEEAREIMNIPGVKSATDLFIDFTVNARNRVSSFFGL